MRSSIRLNNHMSPDISNMCHGQRYKALFHRYARYATLFLIRKQCIRWYRSGPPLSIHSLFRRYFLASPRTNAVCTTTLVILVTSTRGGGSTTEGKRSPRCGGIADRPLSCANIFFFPFLFLLFYHTHASTSSAPTFCPSSPLGFDSPLPPFFLFFSLLFVYIRFSYTSRSQKRDGNEK